MQCPQEPSGSDKYGKHEPGCKKPAGVERTDLLVTRTEVRGQNDAQKGEHEQGDDRSSNETWMICATS